MYLATQSLTSTVTGQIIITSPHPRCWLLIGERGRERLDVMTRDNAFQIELCCDMERVTMEGREYIYMNP